VAFGEVGEQSRVRWPPAEKRLCLRAGCRVIDLCERGKKAEVLRRLIRADADRWQSEAAADGFGDLAEPHALLRGAM